ncbi:MAG: lysylphosphatidylglycerol synthase transmembrane domain-containing protein [Candidatus Bathyarchaeia archaeon]
MDSKQYKITKKTLILPILGILAFIIYLYLFNVDIPTIIAKVREINLPIYLVAAFLTVFETLFAALSWRSLLNFLSVKLSVVSAYMYTWYGIFVDIIIPAESLSSEVARIYLVTREQEGTTGKVVASLVIQRFIGMSINIASLTIGAIVLLTSPQISVAMLTLTLFLAFLTALFFCLLMLLCTKKGLVLKIIDSIIRFASFISRGKWNLSRFKQEAVKQAEIFQESMKGFKLGRKALFTSAIFYIFSWALSLYMVHLVFLSLNFPIRWETILLTYSIVAGVRAIPLGIPFEVGLPEITMTTLYVWSGVPFDIAATSTILSRILTIWLKFFIGFGMQQWLELKRLKTTSGKK